MKTPLIFLVIITLINSSTALQSSLPGSNNETPNCNNAQRLLTIAQSDASRLQKIIASIPTTIGLFMTGFEKINTTVNVSQNRVNELEALIRGCNTIYNAIYTATTGGSGGSPFKDPERNSDFKLKKLIIFANTNSLWGIQVITTDGVTDYASDSHGSYVGNRYEFIPSKKIASALICYNPNGAVNGLKFNYIDGSSSQVYGYMGSGSFAPILFGGEIIGIYGKGGNQINSLGFIYNQAINQISKTISFGGNGGSAFSDVFRQGDAKLKKIYIRVERSIQSIQVVVNDGYNDFIHPPYGGIGGTNYEFVPNTRITSVTVCYTTTGAVDGIRFNYVDGTSSQNYGYFDSGNYSTIPIDGDIIGVFGRSGNVVYKLGFIASKKD